MKHFRLSIVFMMLSTITFADSFLTETKTMNDVVFGNLYDAIDVNDDPAYDEVMQFYWTKLTADAEALPTTRDGEINYLNEEMGIRSSYDKINWADDYSKNSLIGALAVGYIPSEAQPFLDKAKYYLLESTYTHYLSLDEVWRNIDSDTDNNKLNAIAIGDLLFNVAFIVDNLWNHVTSNEQDSLIAKLDNIAWAVNEAINWSTESWGGVKVYPPTGATGYGDIDEINFSTSMNNMRLYLVGALGYAGCVLDSITYIETAENDLFNWLTVQTHGLYPYYNGLIDFLNGNDNVYTEGVGYSEMIVLLNYFFTARKRLYPDATDNFERPEIKAMYVENLHLLTPDFNYVTFDDAHLGNIENTDSYGIIPVQSFSEVMSYYYQGNPSTEEKAQIEWLINGYYETYGKYPKKNQAGTRLYTYNSSMSGAFTSLPAIPQSYSQGSYDGNSEFTIMRPEVNNISEFTNSPYLYVNHENSASYFGHEHSDQSSFVLYTKANSY